MRLLSDNLPSKKADSEFDPFKNWLTRHPFNDLPIANVLESIDNLFKYSILKPMFKVNVKENESEYTLTAELPGVKKEHISINILPNSVTIAVKSSETVVQEDEKRNIYQRSSSFEEAVRTIPLYHPVNDRRAKASYKDGLLTITIPKRFGRKIDINN